MQLMHPLAHSPWYAVTAALLGLIVGYTLVASQSGTAVYAGTASQCPYHGNARPPSA